MSPRAQSGRRRRWRKTNREGREGRSVRPRARVEGAEQGPRAPALLLRSLTTKENWGEGDCVTLQPEKQQRMNQGKTQNRARGKAGGKDGGLGQGGTWVQVGC